jgi:hypothetical protein
LAVVLFQLLFLGRHPYAGLARAGDVSVAEAIADHDFAYSRRRAGRLRPPPGALRLDEIDPAVAALFEDAFAPDAAGRRPTAAAWVSTLERTEASSRPCAQTPRHHVAAGLSACPLCRVERETGSALFPAPGEAGAAPPPIDRSEIARRLASIETPERFAYAPPEPLPSSTPKQPTPRQRALNAFGLVGLAFMMACAVGLVIVTPQSFLMAAPICIYGIGPVGDALNPRRAARRHLAKLDRRLADVLAMIHAGVDLDAAWLLKAELQRRAATLSGSSTRRMTPKQRSEAIRFAQDLDRLEAMARRIAAARDARHPEVETLLARRAVLAEQVERHGDAPPDRLSPPPRRLREATRARAPA